MKEFVGSFMPLESTYEQALLRACYYAKAWGQGAKA